MIKEKSDRPVMAGHDRCGPAKEIAPAASGRFGNIPDWFSLWVDRGWGKLSLHSAF
jgi:hypothetical protein